MLIQKKTCKDRDITTL